MNRRSGTHRAGKPGQPIGKPGQERRAPSRPRPRAEREAAFGIVERAAPEANAGSPGAFRVLIAVHRPRYRGRAERAAALEGWEVIALLNKQDPVGQCAKPPRPPDLLILSGDFGRQKDLAIFRAVQRYRSQGMRLIGMVDDCQAAPEGFPESVPDQLCDICLEPPYRAAGLRALFVRLYEELRGEPAPPAIIKIAAAADEQEEE